MAGLVVGIMIFMLEVGRVPILRSNPTDQTFSLRMSLASHKR